MSATEGPVDLGDRPVIGVVKRGDLGDALLATPMLAALRRRYPGAQIDAIVSRGGRPALIDNPHLDRLLVLPEGGRAERIAFAGRIRRRRYDALLIAHHLTLPSGARRHQLLALASGAPVVAGLDNGRGRFLTHRRRDRGFGAVPEWRYWLDVAALVGATSEERPLFVVDERASEEARRLLAPLDGRPFAALHPTVGAYGPGRAWPVAHFAGLAAALRADPGLDLVIVGAIDARRAAAAIRQVEPTALDLTGATDVSTLAAILARADVTVGADSGVVHLAATLDRPTLALFGPSNHCAWAPFAAVDGTIPSQGGAGAVGRVTVLRDDIACSPCFYIGHALGRPAGCALRSCLTELSVDRVAAVARRVLAQNRVE